MHAQRTLEQLRGKDRDIEKNIFLSQLKATDENLFYKLALEHMTEVTPLIYTPTVGDACLQYSKNFRRPEGLVRVATLANYSSLVLKRAVIVYLYSR